MIILFSAHEPKQNILTRVQKATYFILGNVTCAKHPTKTITVSFQIEWHTA